MFSKVLARFEHFPEKLPDLEYDFHLIIEERSWEICNTLSSSEKPLEQPYTDNWA